MKKLALSALLFGAIFGSCAPTAPDTPDTVILESAPSSATLTRTNTSVSMGLSLNCGCEFGPFNNIAGPLEVTGYGDTSVIKFSLNEPLSKDTTIHTVYATIAPPATSGTSSSWIAFYYLHNGTKQLYDTIRVTANY